MTKDEVFMTHGERHSLANLAGNRGPFFGAIAITVGLLAGCPPAPTPDAGGPNEPEPSVGVDAGPDGLGEGEGCRVDSTECRDDLICLPSVQNPNVGSCRKVCGSVDSGDVVKDEGVACATGDSCQVISGPDALPDFVVCLPVTLVREGACLSANDPAGCDAEAIATEAGVNASQVSCDYAGGLNPPHYCKIRCVIGDDDSCPDGELCFRGENPLLDLEAPAGGGSDRITCTPSVCGAQDPDCECGDGYACRLLGSGETLCARDIGNCGEPVPTLLERQLSFEFRCNGVDDHRFCDDSAYAAIEDGAEVQCVTAFLGFPSDNDGQCLAICSRPTFDYDRSGVVDADEQAQNFNCRDGEVCRTDTFGLRNLGTQACDPEECPPGSPCSACSGDGECVESSSGPRCGVYLGSCTAEEIVDGGPQDAGPDLDAGLESDAGGGEDAGNVDAGVVDAGGIDAGPVDAGSADAGGGPPDAGFSDAGLADAGIGLDAG